MAHNWGAIRKHLSSSRISEFRPVYDLIGDRAFFRIDFGKIERRVTEILALYRNAIKTDITRFYPTIYTHSLPWALYGKTYCKSNLHKPTFKNSFGNQLDVAIRRGQDNQTIGIPIGPDTSRVLGELIGVGVENLLRSLIPDFSDRALRYVDDLVIGYSESESPETILTALTRSFSEFGLDINFEKTTLIGSDADHRPDWITVLRSLRVSARKSRQQGEIEHYFKTALALAKDNERDGVLVYAIKQSRAFRIRPETWPYYVNWLLRTARKYPACLPAIAQIFIENRSRGQEPHEQTVRKFIVDMVAVHTPLRNYFEVCWALFLAKGLSISLKRADVSTVFKCESSACALVLLDLNSRGLITGGVDLSHWLPFRDKATLRGSMWLLAYEGTLKGWLPKTKPCFVETDPLFAPLLKRKVSFYDTRRNVRRTRAENRALSRQKRLSEIIFANLQAYF